MNSQQEVANDFLIPKQETGVGEHHMVIKYEREIKKFLIKDLGEGTGTFVKIKKPLII